MQSLRKLSRNIDLSSAALLITISAIAFAFFAIIQVGFYARYLADDYCTAGIYRTVGFWGAQEFWYTQWTGRFAFTFMITLIETSGLEIVPYLPAILLTLWIITTWMAANQYFKRQMIQSQRGVILLLTLLFLFLVLFSLPNIAQDLYWQTGSFTYLLPIIFWMILTALLWRFSSFYKTLKNPKKFVVSFLVVFVAWFSSGFSEVSGVMQAAALGLVFFWRILTLKQKTSQNNYQLVTLAFIATLVGLAFMVLAPGNVIRQSAFFPNPGLWELISSTTLYSAKFTAKWFGAQSILIWPICMISLTAGLLHQNSESKSNKISTASHPVPFWLYSSFALLLIIFVSFIPSSWSIKREPPNRILILQISFLSAYLILAAYRGGMFLRQAFTIRLDKAKPLTILFLIFCLYFSFYAILFQARETRAPLGAAQNFAQKWDQRHAIILSQLPSTEKILHIEMIGYNIMGLEHIQHDPNNFINVCAARYYGVDQVIAE
ncbi:MAG: hypothetical protein CVU39_16555 [Chloroflexi bacterium HGW-Chloroflexi-10]|nr:MAG: hypothetical protein CVU39_16555 [Chloroflexi bacterium HGW-Chloroflexi-10]